MPQIRLRWRKVCKKRKRKDAPIHGVIHAAGLQGTESILEKDLQTFQQVLSPKADGTAVLDQVLSREPLDFFCCFSSSSAILGDFGSCDYAMGNRFQMAFVRHRDKLVSLGLRSGKSLAINWPLWKEGGCMSARRKAPICI